MTDTSTVLKTKLHSKNISVRVCSGGRKNQFAFYNAIQQKPASFPMSFSRFFISFTSRFILLVKLIVYRINSPALRQRLNDIQHIVDLLIWQCLDKIHDLLSFGQIMHKNTSLCCDTYSIEQGAKT